MKLDVNEKVKLVSYMWDYRRLVYRSQRRSLART